jgi:ribosomal subunit interface protein
MFQGSGMKIPLQIAVRNMPHSAALEERIRENAAKLEEFHARIVSCRVAVEASGKHRNKGRQFEVRIDVRVPGEELVANHAHNEDIYVAVRDAFNAVRHQLQETARIVRGDTKAHQAAPGEKPGGEET